MGKARSISVTTKANAEQYARYVDAAGAKPMSEWVREALDRELDREARERERQAFEAEVLRRLDLLERYVLNVGADLSSQMPITRVRVQQYRGGLMPELK